MRLIENLPSTSRAELLPPASSSRAVVRVPTAATAALVPYVVLPRQSAGNSPFLAQFLVQDADDQPAGEQPSPGLWRQRELAYRMAASPAPSSEINIEI